MTEKLPEKMSGEEIVRLCKEHTMYTWMKGEAADPLPIDRAEGVYMYTSDGQKVSTSTVSSCA